MFNVLTGTTLLPLSKSLVVHDEDYLSGIQCSEFRGLSLLRTPGQERTDTRTVFKAVSSALGYRSMFTSSGPGGIRILNHLIAGELFCQLELQALGYYFRAIDRCSCKQF